jgi:hypothetical protein
MQVGCNRVVPRGRRVDLGQRDQTRPWAVRLAYGDGPIEPGDRAVRQPHQLVVPLDHLHPVGLVDGARIGVQGGDRSLRLELPEPVPG